MITGFYHSPGIAGQSMPHLPKVDFHQAQVCGVDFWGANLVRADLIGATLRNANLSEAKLHEAKLMGADLQRADLTAANLTKADLRTATLTEANLTLADLVEANLSQAILTQANLYKTNFTGANLSEASLMEAHLVRTNFRKANLTCCRIYGISAWELELEEAEQLEMIITPLGEPTITVDNLEVAQFIYLLLHNEKIRHVIDTITSKVVLILGRFTPERKAVLDAIRDALRQHDLLPVLFDFQKPESRDFTETVSTLAHMARFVIADMTEPRIVLEEVPHIVRNIAVPLVPLLLEGEDQPVTLYSLRRNHRSVLPTCWYTDRDDLLASLEEKVIAPARAKAKELQEMR